MSSRRSSRRKSAEEDVDFPGDEESVEEDYGDRSSGKKKKKKKKKKSGGDLLDAEVDDLMEEIISLREQLAEERAERVNLEGTLQKSRKKLARARDQRGASEQSVQQNFVESKRRIKELESQVQTLQTNNAQLKTDLAQWSQEATSLREQMTATTGAGKKVIETVMDENRALKKKLGRLEEELRHTKIDLKFSTLTGSKWRGEEGEGSPVRSLADNLKESMSTMKMTSSFMATTNSSTRGGSTVGRFDGATLNEDQAMFASTSYIPVKSTEELMQNNRYVQIAKARKDLNEAIVDQDKGRLEKAIDVVIEHNLSLESNAGKSVLKMLIEFDASTGTMNKTQEELAELRHEVGRLQGIEEEAKSLRNATTAMGMALESEQEARNEIERELEIEKRERHMTEEELDSHKKSIQTKQSNNETKLEGQVGQLRRDIEREVKRRQKAETELYRSAVAITDHRQMVQKIADKDKLVSDLRREIGIKDRKNRDLEKTIYKSSQIMFEQIEKKVEVERRGRMEMETLLDQERKQRKKLENERVRLIRDLEAGRQHEIRSEKDTRKHLESVVYKSSVSIYKQLEERMKEEARLRAELQSLTNRLVVAERERNAEKLARQNLEAVATRSSLELVKGKEALSKTEQRSLQEIMTRSQILAKREDQFHKAETKYRHELERERKLRQQAEDGHSRVLREAELLRARLKASSQAVREARIAGGGKADTVDQLKMERQIEAVESEARAAAEENTALRKRVDQLLQNQEKLRQAAEMAAEIAEVKTNEVKSLKLELERYQSMGGGGKRAGQSSFTQSAHRVKKGMMTAVNRTSKPLSNVLGFQQTEDYYGFDPNVNGRAPVDDGEVAFSAAGGWREREFDAMVGNVQRSVKRTLEKHASSTMFPPVADGYGGMLATPDDVVPRSTQKRGSRERSKELKYQQKRYDAAREYEKKERELDIQSAEFKRTAKSNSRLEAAYKNLEKTKASHRGGFSNKIR